MKFPRKILSAVLACSACAGIECSFEPLAGGSEIGNPTGGVIIGYAVYANTGEPAAGARVVACPDRFLKDTSGAVNGSDTLREWETVTDEVGFFSVDSLKPGAYRVEINDGQSWGSCTSCRVSAHDTCAASLSGLKPTGRISGTLRLPPGYQGTAYVQVYGLNRIVRAAPDGAFTLSDIPEGSFTLYVLTPRAEFTAGDIGNVAVASGAETDLQTVAVHFNGGAWKYSRRIAFNTTATGADVAGDVVGFPVLIRLNSGTFNFSQAQPTGADIRFTKPDKTFLPSETERWDPATGAAEIWVKADTIHGNDSTQSIMMYWGNPSASGGSNGAAVFDTAAGFAGVWHLAQPKGSIAPDATANGNDGTTTATTTVAGTVGMAQEFNGTSSLIRASGRAVDNLNFPENGTFSVSVWVKTNVLDSVFHGIVYKSNEEYGLQMRPINEWEFCTYLDKSRWEMSRSPVSDNSWHAIAGVRNGPKQYLYIDGRCLDSSIVTLSTYLVRVTDQPLEIGHCPDGGTDSDRYFNGAIDEVRISSVANSADWIKLCYMNQKEPDALVQFK